MADPKSTYNSPNERGFATILPAGPNFLGYAMQVGNQKLRQEQKAADDQAKKDAARERSINQIYNQLSRPNPTDQFYQQDVTEMKNKGLDRMVELDISGADASVIHREAAQLIQELDGYSKAGTQVAGIISGQVKLLRKDPQFKADEIGTELTGKLVDGEGKKMDPQTLDTNELAWEKVVYGQGLEGAKFLNAGAVADAFANLDTTKAQNIKWESEPVATTIGGVRQMTNTAYSQKNKPFLKLSSFDNVGGAKFEVLSPDELIKSGVYQLALNYQPMSLLMKSEAEKSFAGRSVPPTDAERSYEEARALNVILTGQTGGASYGENLQVKRNTPPGASGSRQTQGEKNDTAYITGQNLWQSHVSSSDPKLVKQGLDHINVQLGISEEARTLVTEAVGADPDWEFEKIAALGANDVSALPPYARPKPGIYAVFKNGKKAEYVKIDQEQLGGAFGAQIYAKGFKNTSKNYLEGQVGGSQWSKTTPAKTGSKPKW